MNDPAVAALAASPWVLVVLVVWGASEALAQPIVPDVLLGWLALATPAALGLPLVAAIAGAVAGAVALGALRRARPALVDAMLAAQPGLGPAGLIDARDRVARRGAVRGFAQLGPGLPLKAYVVALLDAEPAVGPARLAGLALVNRVTRIVPVVAAFAALGAIGRPAGLPTGVVSLVYVVGWALFYAAFWWARRTP